MNYLSKMFAFLLSVILLFIVPAYRICWVTDQAVSKQVNYDTCEFVNNVRHKGFVSRRMYEDFVGKLSNTGYVYDIEMKHLKEVWDYVPNISSPDGYETANFFDEYPTEYILKDIFSSEEDRYFMHKGDSFVVSITNKSKTGSMVFMNFLGDNGFVSSIFTKYGGMITNEDY
ncbi:MAG: hypothetical protein WC677_02440 [Clostridia bacterium]|jgi:hypothetical protein